MKTRYSQVDGRDDALADDRAGRAAGEYEVRCFARVETGFDVRGSILRPARAS